MRGRWSNQIVGIVGAALTLLLAGCDPGGGDQPRDGGWPLDLASPGERPDLRENDPCWRREGRGWHLSAGHCNEMSAAQRMTGVWVTGFEESSFFPGNTAMPDRNDPRRFRITLEVDRHRVQLLTGRGAEPPEYQAFALTFFGRRTKYPLGIDCYGGRTYAVVVDRVETARYLGTIANPDRPPLPSERPPYRGFPLSGEGGVIGRMEREALRNCMERTGPGPS